MLQVTQLVQNTLINLITLKVKEAKIDTCLCEKCENMNEFIKCILNNKKKLNKNSIIKLLGGTFYGRMLTVRLDQKKMKRVKKIGMKFLILKHS